MGCTCSKRDLGEIEVSSFSPFELSLGLKTSHCKHIDRIFHRFSTFNYMSQPQFERACSTLKVDLSTCRGFFYDFVKDEKYCVKKLSTLGVLLGSGSVYEKAEILFENYDDDISNTLDVNEIHIMIKDLVSIAAEYIPKFVYKINELNEDLKLLVNKLKFVGNYVAKQYLDDIMDDKLEISKEFFISKLEKKYAGLLRTEEIRKKCIFIYKHNLKPIKHVINAFDSSMVTKNKVLQRHCTLREESSIRICQKRNSL